MRRSALSLMASTSRTTMASSTPAPSSSSSSSGTRSGFFLRQKALSAANKLVAGASALVNNVVDGGEDDDQQRASKPSLYTEERCLVFPGFAFVKNDELTVGLEGFAYRLRPLESASRTQKLFVSAARQLASLPALPKTSAVAVEEEALDIEVEPGELKRQSQEYKERMKETQAPDLAATHGQSSSGSSSASGSTSRTLHNYAVRVRPQRSNTTDSLASVASTASMATTSSARPPSVKYSSASLEVLHDNLHTRLRLFFSQKLVGRRIRVSVYLLPRSPAEDGSASVAEKCVAKGTLHTEVGGVFKSSITVPWVAGDPMGRRLRVRTELLTEQIDDAPEETIDDPAAHERVMGRSDEANVGVTHAHAPIRVISDIDDTIKATHVLGGIKAVFRNVFTRPHEELVVAGMKDWYWEMFDRGACFHFVSNSPFELFGVLREYLKAAGFPPGSMRLKEYGGGTSLLGGLWEAAGQRKRGGVEEILRTFPDSRFLLVGDSGEQDLELYVSLAEQFPRQILGIFIRDVTTPERPSAHVSSMSRLHIGGNRSAGSSTSTLNSTLNPPSNHVTAVGRQYGPDGTPVLPSRPSTNSGTGSARPPRPAVRRNSEVEQEKLLASVAKEEEQAGFFSQSTLLGPSVHSANEGGSSSDADSDEMSPNNPLLRNTEESSILAPLDENGYTEVERKVIAIFRDRLLRAQRDLPRGVLLKIFRSGEECRADAERLMQVDEKLAHADAP